MLDSMVVLLLAAATQLVRVGLGWYGSGMVRSKNAAGAVLRQVLDIAVASLAFWAIGAAIWNAPNGSIIGIRGGLIFDAKSEASSATFMQLVMVLIATSPLTMAMGERCRFFPVLAGPVLLGGLLIPICGHWAWSDAGWLRRMGFTDIAGASVLHVAGGVSAMVAAIIAGPRSGKYNKDGSSSLIPGHSVPMASAGSLLILAAWVPYVAGASMLHGGLSGRIGFNVILAASAGTITAILISHARYGKPDVMLAYCGLLGGLIAMCAGGGAVSTIAAVSTGAIAGLIVPTMTVAMDLRWKIDDPSGLVAVHIFAGAWGTLATGLFAPAANWGARFSQLGIQALGLIVIAIFAAALSVALFILLRATVGLRLSDDAEYDGTDLAEHDLNAYPDFQQTMIKSYHMREA